MRLLRIRRLVSWACRSSQIGRRARGRGLDPDAAQLDAELAGRSSACRRRGRTSPRSCATRARGQPRRVRAVASRLSEADSSIIHIYTQLYDEDALADLRKMVEADTDAASATEIDRAAGRRG